MAQSVNFGLPFVASGQAQKHITINETFGLVDALMSLRLQSVSETAPPVSPSDGEVYAVAAGPTGAWSGNAGDLAARIDGAWQFVTPIDGILAFVIDEGVARVLISGVWEQLPLPADGELETLGVNADFASTSQRFVVRSESSLFSPDPTGSGSAQVFINKDAPGDAASFVFQTGFSGRAEFGTLANDEFSLKVSADGSTFVDALRVDSDGFARFPEGVKNDALTAYKTSSQTLTGSFAAVDGFDGTHIGASGDLTWSAVDGEALVGKAGRFLVSYAITTSVSSGTFRSTSLAELQVYDGSVWATLPGSRHAMYNRQDTAGACSASWQGVLDLAAAEGVRLAVQQDSGTDTLVVDVASLSVVRL